MPAALRPRLDAWCVLLLAAGAALALAGALTPAWMDATQLPRIVDAAAHGIGAWLCVRVARSTTARSRVAWYSFAAYLGLWGAGTLAWGVGHLAGWGAPQLSPLDVVWLGSYVPLFVAVGLIYRTLTPGLGWGGAVDALALTCGLALLGWQVVMEPVAGRIDPDITEALVPAAYPTLDLLVACLVAWLIMRRGAQPGWIAVLLLAMGAQLAGDVGYLRGAALGDEGALWAAEGLWVMSVAGFAAMAASRRRGARVLAQPRPGPAPVWTQLLPLPVALVAGAAAVLNPDALAIVVVAVLAQLLLVARLVGAVVRAERLGRENARLSITDPLTGAFNRRFLDAELPHELARARRAGRPLAVVTLDLDRFKPVNDRLGHGAGDHLLAVCVRAMQARLRPGDRLCRLGGDEFAVLAPEADGPEALALARRLVDAVRLAGEEHAPGIGVSASAGVASYPALPPEPGLMLRAADRALYRAKREGRGRALVADSG